MAIDSTKQAYWTEHFHRWESSGLSQRDYCRQEGLAFSSFGYWRHRMAITDTSGATSSASLTWVSPKVDDRDQEGGIRVRSPGGWEISLPPSFDLDRLAALLGRLA